MNDYKITYNLKQQTPLIHFQHYEKCACLRPSEVRPLLDKFIFGMFGGLEQTQKDHPDWFIGYHPNAEKLKDKVKDLKDALNYKMQIIANCEPSRSSTIENAILKEKRNAQKKGDNSFDGINVPDTKLKKINSSYFGNMVSGKGVEKAYSIAKNFKESVFYIEPLDLTIICFIPTLMDAIDTYIREFFLVNNFGTRQTKGFGSFIIDGTDIREIVGKTKYIPLKKACFIDWSGCCNTSYAQEKKANEMLSDIAIIAKLMKSGVNNTTMTDKSKNLISPNDYYRGYIFRTYSDSDIKNDKAFIKQSDQLLGRYYQNELNGESQEDGSSYLFVRAMLGLTEGYSFTKIEKDVKISHTENPKSENYISRFNNPITFKPVNDYILIIPHKIPDELFKKKEFRFTIKDRNSTYGSSVISIPAEFDTALFLKGFAEDFNNKDDRKGGCLTLAEAQHPSFKNIKKLSIEPINSITGSVKGGNG